MIRKPTLILLSIFVVMAVGLYFWQGSQSQPDRQETATSEVQFLFETSGRKIIGIILYDSLGSRVELQRTDQDEWFLVEPADEVADETRIQSAVAELESLRVLSKLEPPPQKEVVGLNDPAHFIKVIYEDNQEDFASIGDETPTGSGYYVSLNGGAIWVINKLGIDSLLSLISDPPIIRTPTPTPTLLPELTATPEPS